MASIFDDGDDVFDRTDVSGAGMSYMRNEMHVYTPVDNTDWDADLMLSDRPNPRKKLTVKQSTAKRSKRKLAKQARRKNRTV